MPQVLPITIPETITLALEALQAGELVVLPTDTVYGVAARIDADAIARIFEAKQRPPERAVPVLLSDAEAAEQVVAEFLPMAWRLAAAFWPGPLTIALLKRAGLPANLSTLPTVGVRVPDHTGARDLIRAAGGALAVTSANLSDRPAPRTVHEAIAQLGDSVAVYVDGGQTQGGVPSTVITFETETLRVLREGPISTKALNDALKS